jgi:fibronectin type III domain protein/galactose oxidase-like protein/Kelch motif protein
MNILKTISLFFGIAFFLCNIQLSALTARHSNTTTLMADGDIVVIGGVINSVTNTPTATVEIYFTTAAAWGDGASLANARSSHTATLLSDGRILVTGGFNIGVPINSSEIYNPITKLWAATGDNMAVARGGHTATLLTTGTNSGNVLICGGQSGPAETVITATCDMFDTSANTFSPVTSMNSPRMAHTANLFSSGRVFVSGGRYYSGGFIYLPDNEIYDSVNNVWAPVDSLAEGRALHSATVLNNGNVMIAGGYNAVDQYDTFSIDEEATKENQNQVNLGYLGSVEMFDPGGARVPLSGSDFNVMPYRNSSHGAVLRPDGRVNFVGGYGNFPVSYFKVAPIIEEGSYLDLTPIPGTLSSATISGGDLGFPLELQLSREVSGRLVNANIYFSQPIDIEDPSITIEGVDIFLERSTSVIDGMPIIKDEDSGVGGVFTNIVNLTGMENSVPLSQVVFPLAEVDPEIDIVGGAGSVLNFSPDIGESEEADLTGGSLTLDLAFQVSPIYIGGTITATAKITAGTITDDLNYWTVTLAPDAGVGIPGGVSTPFTTSIITPITVDGTLYGLAEQTGVVFSSLEGRIFNTTITVINSPVNPTGTDTADSFTMDLEYTASKIQLTLEDKENAYSFDQSTVVVREMIFADKLNYAPDESEWEIDLNAPFLPVFSHNLVFTPADDLATVGGKNCEADTTTFCDRGTKRFDPINNSVIYVNLKHGTWEEVEELNTKRAFHTSTLLPDNSILTCGGSDGTQPLNTCELLNPISHSWNYVYPMTYTRSNHTATLLANGTVLIAGGKLNSSTAAINNVDIYYPDTYKFIETTPMNSNRANHTATLLPDGNVLVSAGSSMSGYSDTSEIYITTSATWQTVGSLAKARSQHTATLLKNGNVMVVGGINSGALNTTEIFNPTTKSWSAGPNLNMKRYDHATNLLKDGRVFVSGGSDGTQILKTAEIYNGTSWTYSHDFPGIDMGNDMLFPRANHNSTLLPNGKLLVTGGEEPSIAQGFVEGFDVDFSTWQYQGEMKKRVAHTTILMNDGYLMNIGGFDGGQYLSTTEKTYFASEPDSFGRPTAIARQPLISTGTRTFDKGDRITLLSATSSFHGITEASGGGGGPMNSSYHNPRVYIQQIDNPSGYLTDLTTSLYTLYGGPNSNWEMTTSSITLIMPPTSNQIPYGFYNFWIANNAVFSNGFTVQVTSQRPTAVASDILGAVVSSTTIDWSWDGAAIVTEAKSDGYTLFASSNNVFITTVALATPAFTQNTLTPNTMSSIKIAGYNLGGNGDFVESATYYTLAATPTDLAVNSASFEMAALEWSNNFNSNFTTYELSMSASNNTGDCFTTDISTPIVFNDNHTSTSTTLNQLSANQFYCFRVRAKNGADEITSFSANASTVTVGNVTNLQGTAISLSEIRWAWDPTTGVDWYDIYDVTAGTTTEDAVLLSSATTSLEYYSQIGLSTNTIHVAMVRAVKSTGDGPVNGPPTISTTVYTLAVAPLLGVPNALTNITTGSINVNWIANGNPENTGYKVEVYNTDLGNTISYTGGTEVYVNGLTPNTSYTAIITAYNGDNIPNEITDLGSVYTIAQPPSNVKPSTIAMSGVTIVWDTGDNPPGTYYQVRGSTDNFITISTYVAFADYHTDDELSINGLMTSTTYYFDVAAINGELIETAKIQCVPDALTLAGPNSAPTGSIAGTSDPSKTTVIDGELPNGRYVSMSIPSLSFTGATAIAISSSITNSCGYLIDGKPLEVAIFSEAGAQPQVPITLTMDYTGTEALDKITANETKLVLARYNPVSGQCLPLKTTINVGLRTITANLNHFSVFQLILKTAATNLNNISVYPNPFYPNRGQGFVTIDNIPANSAIRIYTLAGTKVWSGNATSTGLAVWDGVNKYNELVASGIYLCVIDSSVGKKIIKLAVER